MIFRQFIKSISTQAMVAACSLLAVFVSPVEADQIWSLDRLDQPYDNLDNSSFIPFQTGDGVYVFVVDTGVMPNHSDFTSGQIPGGWAFDDLDYNDNDTYGHGTRLAGIIGGDYGVARDAAIIPVKVHTQNGVYNVNDITRGLNWIRAVSKNLPVEDAKVVLFGFSLNESNTFVDAAVQNLLNDGITVVAPVRDFLGDVDGNGNYITGKNQLAGNYSPGRVSGVITVAGTGYLEERKQHTGGSITYDVIDPDSWGNYHRIYPASESGQNFDLSYPSSGVSVDILAPGSYIKSATNYAVNDHGYYVGSEMAAAYVAGFAAHYLENNPAASPQKVKDALRSTASILGNVVPPNTTNKLLQLTDYPKIGTVEKPANARIHVETDSVHLAWDDVDPNTTGFIVNFSEDLSKWETIATLPRTTVEFSHALPTPGNPVFFRIYAKSATQFSEAASPIMVSSIPQGQVYTPPPPAAPIAPSNFSASPYMMYTGPQSGYVFQGATINWTDNSNNEVVFELQYKGPNGIWSTGGANGPNSTSGIVHFSHTCSSTQLRVVAVDANGNRSSTTEVEYFYYCN